MDILKVINNLAPQSWLKPNAKRRVKVVFTLASFISNEQNLSRFMHLVEFNWDGCDHDLWGKQMISGVNPSHSNYCRHPTVSMHYFLFCWLKVNSISCCKQIEWEETIVQQQRTKAPAVNMDWKISQLLNYTEKIVFFIQCIWFASGAQQGNKLLGVNMA